MRNYTKIYKVETKEQAKAILDESENWQPFGITLCEHDGGEDIVEGTTWFASSTDRYQYLSFLDSKESLPPMTRDEMIDFLIGKVACHYRYPGEEKGFIVDSLEAVEEGVYESEDDRNAREFFVEFKKVLG